MAVIWNSLTFGSVNSLDYGIFVTGDAVYNAPERAVERVSVAGRNGDILIDQGHWNNIEVSYPCGTFAETASDFSRKIAAFRNAVVSQLGYQRLSDTYNDSEYRMADASAGFDVTPTLGKAGEFTLTFNCKPQRWLASGEASITVADGETLVNPTLYDAHPLLAVEGYGTIGFNGYEVEISNAEEGNVYVVGPSSWSVNPKSFVVDVGETSTGELTLSGGRVDWLVQPVSDTPVISAINSIVDSGGSTSYARVSKETVRFSTLFPSATFNKTDTYTKTVQSTVNLTIYFDPAKGGSGFSTEDNVTMTLTINYASGVFNFQYSLDIDDTTLTKSIVETIKSNGVTTYSTKPMLGHPTYIDCDLGEAYKYEDGSLISLNKYIALGSDLPCLANGDNLITADNTITELKITPRWWIL